MPSTTSNNLNTSAKWDGSNETHDGYKAWVNHVSLWANQNQMAWIMKIAKRLQEAPNFRRPVSRALPLREQFLDEAQAARDKLLAEIQRSAETDEGEDPAEDEQANDVTCGHKMMCTRRNPTGTLPLTTLLMKISPLCYESYGSDRCVCYFFPSEAVQDKLHSP